MKKAIWFQFFLIFQTLNLKNKSSDKILLLHCVVLNFDVVSEQKN